MADVLPTSGSRPRDESWEATIAQSIGLGASTTRVRILRPNPPVDPALVEAAGRIGGVVAVSGDRVVIEGDPRALLASGGIPPGFSTALELALRRRERRSFALSLSGGRVLRLGDPPAVFGVINATPDSFSDGGRYLAVDAARSRAAEMVAEGVDAIDVGGESTRPGASEVAVDEEIERVVPIIRAIRAESVVPISVDTTKADVARAALDAGADIVNDVSALTADSKMADVARDRGALVILMHRRGGPKDMQIDPRYTDVVREVYEYLAARVQFAVDQGLDRERLIVDPGIGFGKTVEHNLTLLRDLDEFRCLGLPVLVGASRKSFMGRLLGELPPENRLASTLAAHAVSVMCGAAALRVHDVVEHRHLATILHAIALGRKPTSPAGGPA